MKTILIFGASIVHGVGGAQGGWADKVKAKVHEQMFSPNGAGETAVVYELGIPGRTLPDLLGRFESELRARVPQGVSDDTIIIFSAGANDAKAHDTPDNYHSTADDFAANVHSFIHLAQDYTSQIIAVGLTAVDESKTMPKISPFTGGNSYFSNQRLQTFEQALERTCEAENVRCVPLIHNLPANWNTNYLYKDGLHPNDAGHQWIFEQVFLVLSSMMDDSGSSKL